jgi:hypothetical protein
MSADAAVIEGLDDQATLAEIDEDLVRADLSPAETALHTAKRKEIYERLPRKSLPLLFASFRRASFRLVGRKSIRPN